MCAPTCSTGFWQPRTQASIDLVLYILFFLPAVAAFIYSGWNYAAMSVRFREVSIFSPAGVPVFPLKTLIPVTGVLLLLQGIAEIIRCVLCIRDGRLAAAAARRRGDRKHHPARAAAFSASAASTAQAAAGHKGTGA